MSRRRSATAAALLSWALLCVRWFDAGAPFRPALARGDPAGAAPGRAGRLRRGALARRARNGRAFDGRRGAPPRRRAGGPVPPAVRRAGRGRGGDAGRGPVRNRRAARARRGRAPGVRPARAVQRQPEVAPDGAACGRDRSRARVRARLRAVLRGVRRRRLPPGVARGGRSAWTARAAGLYAAFAPAFVTRYSVSNDGNYVEVLALGTWAAVLAARWARAPGTRLPALGIGLLLGVAGWCHILALIPLVAIGIALLLADARRALRSSPEMALGLVAGYFPALVWNAGNGWASFRYLLPGGGVGDIDEGPGLLGRLAGMVTDSGPCCSGSTPGTAPPPIARCWCSPGARSASRSSPSPGARARRSARRTPVLRGAGRLGAGERRHRRRSRCRSCPATRATCCS